MASETIKSSPSSSAPKHRACDECRARKLACSKEPDGCARCKREGIQCHYSPQKPMGRPRKRRHVEDSESDVVAQPAKAPVANGDALVTPPQFTGFDAPTGLSLNPSMDFMVPQSATSDLAFLDLLPTNYGDDVDDGLYGLNPYAQSQAPGQDALPLNSSTLHMQCATGDLFQGINFDEPDPTDTGVSKDISDSLQRFMESQRYAPVMPERHVECGRITRSSPDTPIPPIRAMPSTTCGCLSSLYLALESLSHLPPDVTTAMRVARGACKVAQEVIDCRQCSNAFFDDPLKPPPIQAFQNLMCLGALVPSACNAYASILEMVDNETALAKKESRTIYFSFKEVGGLWGNVVNEHSSCSAIQGLNNSFLAPDVWRTTIRAILKLDIYGVGGSQGGPAHAPRRQKGLKDVLAQLDETSRRRHEIMDEIVASGQAPTNARYIMSHMTQPPCPPEQRNCVRILETARIALESLAIT
ncbi:hypothetical protein ACCO45_003595 [Purpureocillium lilacinum]|uniref:Uncharacterized protein n=1 Tax=Purpureocillium lilacinum TaxID=33203 RepID=A0ACC4E1L8_PURLI